MGTPPLRFSRRLCAIVLSLAISGQAALADAAASSVWSDRRRPASSIETLPLPVPTLARLSPAPGINTPPCFVFASAIPAHFGTLRSLGASPAKRSVLLIQDIHLNSEAQVNIAGAVSSLLHSGAVDMVGLEGAAGPLGLEAIAQAPDASSLSLAADFLLKQNMISGAARAALDPRVTTPLIGLDDDVLHERNADAYRRAAPVAAAAKRAIEAERADLARAKIAAFNLGLLAFDSTIAAYRDGRASFADHAAALQTAAEKIHQPVPAPLSLFVTLARLEKSIDTTAVERERSMVISRLARVLDPPRARRLLELGNAFRAGLVRHSAFYAEFGAICRASGINLSTTPALVAYLRYVAEADRVDPDATLRAAGELEATLYSSLIRTAAERRIVRADRRAHLAARLVSFEMTRPEWEEWARDTNADAKLPALTNFESFYQRAIERDAAIAENLIAGMDRQQANRAAVVIGGFHAEGLIRKLAARGINTAVFTPAVSHANANGTAYLSVFTRAKTPIETLIEGRALFLAQDPIPPAAKFAIVHLAAARSIASGVPTQPHVSWISRVTGWRVNARSSSRGQVAFDETDRDGRAVSVVVDGATAEGFTRLPTVGAAAPRLRLGWKIQRAILVARTRALILLSQLLRSFAAVLEPAPLTASESSAELSQRRLAKLRAFLASYSDGNILGVVIFGSVAAGTAREDSDLDYMIIKRDGGSSTFMEETDMTFHLGLTEAFPDVEHQTVSPLILNASVDQQPGESFEMIIRLFFLPGELSGEEVHNARVQGAPFIQNWTVVARSPEEEAALTALIAGKMKEIRERSGASAAAPAFASVRVRTKRAPVATESETDPILPDIQTHFTGQRRLTFADLETGSGRFVGNFKKMLQPAFAQVEGVGIDTLQSSVKEKNERILHGAPDVPGDYEQAGLGDATHDIVTVNAIESKIPELMDQAARIVRPGGLIIVTFERYDIPLGYRVDLQVRARLEALGFVVEERRFPTDYPRSDTFEQNDDLILVARRADAPQDGGTTAPRERGARILGPLARAWRSAVVEVRRTLDFVTFLMRDHRNVEFLGFQKRAVALAAIYTAMIWAPFKLGVLLAASTTLDPSTIILISVLSIPLANIVAHGIINTVWLAVSPLHRILSRFADDLEDVALASLARFSARALEPAPLTMDGHSIYQDRLHDYLATISSPDEKISQTSQTFNAMADLTEHMIQGPMERGKIFEAWASAVTHTRYPLEKFLAAFLRRWIGREPHAIFTWMREIVTVLAHHAEDARTADLQRLVIESFADAAAQIQDVIFHEHSSRKASQPIRLVEITPEVAPFRKAGGMGMVNGILPLEVNKFHGWATTISMRYDDGDYSGEEIVTVDGRRGSPPLRFTVEIPGEERARVATVTKIRRYSSDGVTFADFYFFKDTTRGATNLTQQTYMKDFPDELKYKQAVFLSEGSLQLMKMLVKSGQMKKPDVVRGHDWQAGLALIFMKTRAYAEDADMREVLRGVKTMAFFHNLERGYRGEFPRKYWHLFGLPNEDLQGFGWVSAKRRPDGGHRLEGFDESNMMVTKAMAHHVDAMYVPAPTYALMVQTPWYGHDMWSMFDARHDALRGVLNGTDYDQAEQLIFPMGPRTLQDFVDHKRRAKIALLKELRPPSDNPTRPNPSMWEQIEKGVRDRLGPDAQASEIDAALQFEIDRPIVGAVVRLDVAMKGTNMYLALVRKLTREYDGQYIRFVLMGTKENADAFVPEMAREAAAAPDRIYFLPEGGRGLTQPIRDINVGGPILSLNNLIEAGIDIPAYPSNVEPCGLSDVQGLNRGGVVVVSAAGGFKDKNVDLAEETEDQHPTGVMFGPVFGDDRPTLKRVAAPFNDDGFVRTVERLLDVYYNDRGRFNRIAADNKNLRFTNADMARGHITSLAFFLGRKDIEENPEKPFQKLTLGAVAAWRSIGIRNPVFIGVLEGALTILSIAVAVSALMPLGPPAAGAVVSAVWLAGATVASSVGVLAILWAAHYFGGVLETDGTISIRDAERATAATLTAASSLLALPLLLIPFILGDAVTAWHFVAAAAALAGAMHGGINAVRTATSMRPAPAFVPNPAGVSPGQGLRNAPPEKTARSIVEPSTRTRTPAVTIYEDAGGRRRIKLDSIPAEARAVIERFRHPALNGNLGITGGFVRDLLLGREFNDIDVLFSEGPRSSSLGFLAAFFAIVFPGQGEADEMMINGQPVEVLTTAVDESGRMPQAPPDFTFNRFILEFDEKADPYLLDGENGFDDLFPESGPSLGRVAGDRVYADENTLARLLRRALDTDLDLNIDEGTVELMRQLADSLATLVEEPLASYSFDERVQIRATIETYRQWRHDRAGNLDRPPFNRWDPAIRRLYENRAVGLLRDHLNSQNRTAAQAVWSLQAILRTSTDSDEAATAIENLGFAIYVDPSLIGPEIHLAVIESLDRKRHPSLRVEDSAAGYFKNVASRVPAAVSLAMFRKVETMLGRRDLVSKDFSAAAEALALLISQRPDLAGDATVTALERFMGTEGHDPFNYDLVATALKNLAASRPELIKADSLTRVLLEFPSRIQRHAFSHHEIYRHASFAADATPEHRYSVGLAAARILYRRNQPLTDETGNRAVRAIEAERARISNNPVVGPGYRAVRAVHAEERFDAERLARIAGRAGIDPSAISPAYRGQAAKDQILSDLGQANGPVVFMFSGHGSETHLWLENGHAEETEASTFRLSQAINFEELGNALLKNARLLPDGSGLDMSHVTVLIEACHSYNFGAYLLFHLQKNGVKNPPVIVTSSNANRFSFDSVMFESIDKLNQQGPLTFGHLFKAEEEAFGTNGFADFGIFDAESPELGAAIGGVSETTSVDLGLAGVTRRILGALGVHNPATVATVGGLLESIFILAIIPLIAVALPAADVTPVLQLLAFPAIHFLGGAQVAVRKADGTVVLERRPLGLKRLIVLTALGAVFHLLIPSGIAGAAAHAAFNFAAVVIASRGATRAKASTLSREVARALVERTPLGRRQAAWTAALEGDLRAQPATVGVTGMAERPLPSLAPMERRDFDQDAFLAGLRVDLESMHAVHETAPMAARAAAETVALSGLQRVPVETSLNTLDASRLNIVVFDGMRDDDAARTIERIRANPEARAIVVHDPANARTRALADRAATLSNVTVVADGSAFEKGADGGRRLLLRTIETRLMTDKLIAPSLHIFTGKALELDTNGLGDNSPFRAALYTILDALLSMTASFNRMSLLDASYKLIASQA